MSSIEISKPLLVLCFASVVELFSEAFFDLFHHFGWIETTETLFQYGAKNVGVL